MNFGLVKIKFSLSFVSEYFTKRLLDDLHVSQTVHTHFKPFGSPLVEPIMRIFMNKSETDSTKMSIFGYCG